MRTVDVARRSGYSVQQIRNLERDGVLPPATRSAGGHRDYTDRHVLAARAYRALAAGVGPAEARVIVRAAHRPPPAHLLELLDAAHARLDAERRNLRTAQEAARSISAEPILDVRADDAMTISELAAALGVRSSTLRHWHAEGLVVPDRDATGHNRVYSPDAVRDARITDQLRRAGYRIDTLRTLLPDLRHTGARQALDTRDTALTARSRALLTGAAALGALLDTAS
ncbi:DNA-binding transcriptional MerR regulator [Catenuloplanes nepalensis]|uniref:DNA-binding transcriptional MerR regulator n=1 Tax=Catenuloplanes nepalensis TaxID=587533 RepID=A0ABT9MQW6_9ACTN|nr:MerR family transcriptional regulator [Catenuloplanes nepalensis]MDP9793824.1 DNA-binding transcriptional MerR regulator [Catenuloplanes nepalensis]